MNLTSLRSIARRIIWHMPWLSFSALLRKVPATGYVSTVKPSPPVTIVAHRSVVFKRESASRSPRPCPSRPRSEPVQLAGVLADRREGQAGGTFALSLAGATPTPRQQTRGFEKADRGCRPRDTMPHRAPAHGRSAGL